MASGGGEVEILADEEHAGGFLLLLDRIRQSFVAVDDPTYLEFPYVQVLGEIIHALPPGPIDAVHVGGGAATLPRWLAATRPGSNQQVFEVNAELLRMVEHRLPIAPDAGIDVRLQEGRAGIRALPDSSADLIVVDAFSAGRVPADLTTVEFFHDVARVMRRSGVLLVNTTATAGSQYLRRLIAAVAAAELGEILVFGEQDGEVGNVVLAAALAPAVLPPMAGIGPLGRPLALSGPALAGFLTGAAPLTDADPMRSPMPRDEIWRVGGAG